MSCLGTVVASQRPAFCVFAMTVNRATEVVARSALDHSGPRTYANLPDEGT